MNYATSAHRIRRPGILAALLALTLAGCPQCPRYVVSINPSDFVAEIDNPYHPLRPGTTYTFEKETDEGVEVVVIAVTDETKLILGVQCVVVHDTESLDGVLVEDTYDWYAQDKEGNVWYFGEDTRSFEDGEFVSDEGLWEAGVDGALPGIVMKASPRIGDMYYQEFLCDVAEDQARVAALDVTVTVAVGTFTHCVKTFDFTRLDPTVVESKYYAPDIGFVLAEEPDGMLELVGIEAR